MTLTPTEIESLRIAIAEECGWTCGNHNWFLNGAWQNVSNPPPYTTSIDSIREAAMERFKEYERELFEIELLRIQNTGGRQCYTWQLSALDWAIAFARTAKIWRWKA